MSSRRTLVELLASGLTERSLLSAAVPEAVWESALTDHPGLTGRQAARLIAAEGAAVRKGEITEHFVSEGREGVLRSGEIEGEPVDHLLLATYDAQGRLTGLKSFLNRMYAFTLVRDQVRRSLPDLPVEVWNVPELSPDTGEFHAKPSHDYSPSLRFHSPVLRRSVSPEPMSRKLLGHASSVYGDRQWSDLALNRGDQRMALFAGDIKGRPIEIAAVLRFDTDGLADIKACSRPWAASLAVYSRIKARVGDELGPAYFWDEQPDYTSYR
ncbi:hypothetical protein [Streptomyces liangshanensis]|uniref:Uncharacterized protein n=1 Tax=Streptomyces liangshanensis TaxID=2717324 RepID=A0A6G9GS57_9ACTN|nr:hypothetical protein [Streptomyces liangshanensis]QIQ01040.1 hypothetical protein HA039_00890 [Streptomyces liangshanensis]